MTKVADNKGRISLGNEFAGRMFIIDDTDPKRIVLTPAIAIPEHEAWLYKNKKAQKLVEAGLRQARTGQFSENPPDLDADEALIAQVEGSSSAPKGSD